jgi:hypothetical protein
MGSTASKTASKTASLEPSITDKWKYDLFSEFIDTHMEEQPSDDGSPPWTISFIQLASAYLSFLISYKNHKSTVYCFHQHVYTMLDMYIKKNPTKNIHKWGISNELDPYRKEGYIGLYISGLRLSKVPLKQKVPVPATVPTTVNPP